jgi:Mrp family chromosome partitioning ATPase
MTPPILRHADGTLASLFCDGVVLVARAGITPGYALAQGRQQLERAGTTVLGVALTRYAIRSRSLSGATWERSKRRTFDI